MPTLGEELKRRREERGITLPEIAESTRIGTRFLKAIEDGNFSVLPGGIFTRSFIRAYAKKVGMDEDEAVTLYHDQTAEKPPTQAIPSSPEAEQQPVSGPAPASPFGTLTPASRPVPRAAIAIVGAAVVVLAVIGVLVFRRGTDQEPKTAQSVGAANASKSTAPAGVQPQPNTQLASNTAGVPGQPIDITLEATNGASWIRYQVDQGETATLTLQPGESKVLPPARDEIKLNLGNRTTLRLKIDNHDATFPAGTPNFAAQVTISHDNIQEFIPR